VPDLIPTSAPDLATLEERAESTLAALRPKQAAFVRAVVAGSTLTAAATAAGYNDWRCKYATKVAKLPKVRAAIDAGRALAGARAGYDAARMFKELDEAAAHARQTENSSALVRAIELKGKLAGILVDRVDARVAVGGFILNVHGVGGADG
jgi:hypothetical protein